LSIDIQGVEWVIQVDPDVTRSSYEELAYVGSNKIARINIGTRPDKAALVACLGVRSGSEAEIRSFIVSSAGNRRALRSVEDDVASATSDCAGGRDCANRCCMKTP